MSMQTLIAYPSVNKRAEAFQLLDTGEVCAPLWPFVPRDENPLVNVQTKRTPLPVKSFDGPTKRASVTSRACPS